MFGSSLDSSQLLQALYETLYMVTVSLVIGALIGIPLGILLVVTRKNGIWSNTILHQVLNPIINILRSIPFIILLIAIVPFTKLLVGTSIGTTAAIVPLTVYVAPYIARLVENSLLEVDDGLLKQLKQWVHHLFKLYVIFIARSTWFINSSYNYSYYWSHR